MNSLLTLLFLYFSLASCSLYYLDSYAFQALYTTTKGPQWTIQPPSQTEPCGWTVGTQISVVCVGDRITQLKIQNNNLAGTIPLDFTDLTELVTLDLQSNSINGVFPSLPFTDLTNLNIKGNKFIGSLPDISSLTSLDYIDVSNNHFSSPIPSEYTSRNFTTLYLLGGNNICPLQNYSTNAVNNDSPNSFTCSYCDTFTCAGRGTCSSFGSSYSCSCNSHYFGINCEIDSGFYTCNWDDCQTGYCDDNTGDCVCPTGFAGDDCVPDPCVSNPCKNGGTCGLSFNSEDFYCNCPIDYTGNTCEQASGYQSAVTLLSAIVNSIIYYPVIFGCGVLASITGAVVNKEARNEVIFSFFLAIANFIIVIIISCLSGLYFLVLVLAPVAANYIALGVIYSTELKGNAEVDKFTRDHIVTTIFAFFFGGFNTEIFTIIGSKVFRLPMFSLEFPHEAWKKIVLCGFITNIIQDIAFLGLALYVTIITSTNLSASLLYSPYYICIGGSFISLLYGFIRRPIAACEKPHQTDSVPLS